MRAVLVEPFGGRLSVYLPRRIGDRVIEIPVFNGLELHVEETGWMASLLAAVLPLREGTFVDVGANMGQTLLNLLACDKERGYVGWEPNPACVYYLNALIARNRLRQCTIVPAALSDHSGVARLYLHDGATDDTAATIIEGYRPRHTNLTSTIISVATFDAAWSVVGGDRIGFVKIDVEGAALQVLRGMTRVLSTERPPILCEILRAPRESKLEDTAAENAALERLFQEHSYSILHIIKPQGVIRDVERVDHLPLEFWSEERREDCDYLLVPREQEAEYRAAARNACAPSSRSSAAARPAASPSSTGR